jgi:endonuclease I
MRHQRLATALTSLVLLTLTACSTGSAFQQQPMMPSLTNGNRLGTFSAPRNGDWFSALPPALQQYYAPAQGKTGEALFDALHDIISRNNRITSYGDSKSFMYAVADNIEFNGKTGVFDAYSYQFVPGSGGNGNSYKEIGDANRDGVAGDFINCEHTWPQSFFNKQLPMVADIHHLFSTLSVPNNRRGHHPFGMANSGVIYTTNGGSKLGVMDRTGRTPQQLAQLVAQQNEENEVNIAGADLVFEPGNQHKGNTARGLFYFYLRYHKNNIRSGAFHDQGFWDSKVATFRQWAEQVDLPDDQERRRNDLVHGKQGNRNPFVDIPNLASLIGEDVFRRR